MNKLLIILGSTATGKTSLGLDLAEKFHGEIVSCDSRQVYKGLDIGTGKIPNSVKRHPEFISGSSTEKMLKQVQHDIQKSNNFWKINGIKIWMYDVVTADKQYTVADYVKDANKIIKNILSRGKLPIVVGGTGLYIKGLLGGIQNLSIPLNEKLRIELGKLTKEELQTKLQTHSLKTWEAINNSDRENPRRLLRHLEIISMNPYTKKQNKKQLINDSWDVLKIGLTAPRNVLYKNVDLSIANRLNNGMIQEVIDLKDKIGFERLKELGLEYRVIIDYLEGMIKSKSELMSGMRNKTHNYVKRQLTWFKNEKNVEWFDITDESYRKQVEKLVDKWYYLP